MQSDVNRPTDTLAFIVLVVVTNRSLLSFTLKSIQAWRTEVLNLAPRTPLSVAEANGPHFKMRKIKCKMYYQRNHLPKHFFKANYNIILHMLLHWRIKRSSNRGNNDRKLELVMSMNYILRHLQQMEEDIKLHVISIRNRITGAVSIPVSVTEGKAKFQCEVGTSKNVLLCVLFQGPPAWTPGRESLTGLTLGGRKLLPAYLWVWE